MTCQPALFDEELLPFSPPPPPAPFVKSSQTSREAAEAIAPHCNALQLRVLRYLAAQPGGATDERMQEALSLTGSTQRPRRVELEQAGLVRDSGAKAKTRSGRQAVVWECSDAGRALAQEG